MPTLAQEFATFACGLKYADIPEQVIEKAKIALLHNLGVALAGFGEAKRAMDMVKECLVETGSSLLVDGSKVPMADAAFANGVLIHSRAQEDIHMGSGSHIGPAVTPAALAIAEQRGSSGEEFLSALVAAYEVTAAAGNGIFTVNTQRGFRSSGIYGPIGAAVAAGKLLHLNEQQMANAISLAANFAAGLNQTWISGTMEWRFQVGMASRNGVTAALLASKGGEGAPDALEGAAGFYKAFLGQAPPQGMTAKLGKEWEIHKVTFKPYPVCALNQTPVHVVLRMVSNNDIKPGEIESIRMRLNPNAINYPGTNSKGPFIDVGGTLMSAQFCLATAIVNRRVRMDYLYRFTDETVMDLAQRIELEPDPELSFTGCRISIKNKNGSVAEDQLLPDATTFNFDRDEAKAVITGLLPEMQISQNNFDRFIEIVLDLENYSTVAELIQSTVA